MRKILCVFIILYSSTVLAKSLPLSTHGKWLSEAVVSDDGAYGKYYRSWLFLNDDSIDEIFTLGDHYTKTKFVIRSLSDDGKMEIVDVEEPWVLLSASLSTDGKTLRFCRRSSCLNFSRTHEEPRTEDPIQTTPVIEIKTVWCVETDCVSQSYLPLQNEQLFNLNTGVQVQGGSFEGPLELEQRYGLKLSLSSISYRLTDKTHLLEAYSSVFYLMGSAHSSFTEKLAQSSVLQLQEGLLSELQATLKDQNISVKVFIKKL